jgi:hypothetical protein
MNVEAKQQPKQWMHTHSSNEPKSLNKRLPARKPMATVFWVRKEVLMVEFMQQGMTIMSHVTCVLQNTKEIA